MKTDETCFEQADFQELYNRHGIAIASFLARKYLQGDSEQARKIAKWAFRHLRRNPKLYDRKYKLRPLLFTIAANRAIKCAASINTVAIAAEYNVLPCDVRGLIKLVRKGGWICPGLSSRLNRPN